MYAIDVQESLKLFWRCGWSEGKGGRKRSRLTNWAGKGKARGVARERDRAIDVRARSSRLGSLLSDARQGMDRRQSPSVFTS